jgi:phenylalanyl-tRNA synthetase beta chain
LLFEFELALTLQVEEIRPFIVGAVLRNVTFDQFAYDSFIELQDKLHQGLCRYDGCIHNWPFHID